MITNVYSIIGHFFKERNEVARIIFSQFFLCEACTVNKVSVVDEEEVTAAADLLVVVVVVVVFLAGRAPFIETFPEG